MQGHPLYGQLVAYHDHPPSSGEVTLIIGRIRGLRVLEQENCVVVENPLFVHRTFQPYRTTSDTFRSLGLNVTYGTHTIYGESQRCVPLAQLSLSHNPQGALGNSKVIAFLRAQHMGDIADKLEIASRQPPQTIREVILG